MYLYEIRNTESDSVYVGITRTSLNARFRAHRCCAKRGIKTPLYDSMRAKGSEKFSIHLVAEFETEEQMLNAEKELIAYHRNIGKCYNILDGGSSYFPIKNLDAHKERLKAARVGRKPALGMKHTEENKQFFSECGKARWDLYGRYPREVLNHSFIEANNKFGISKTHYYRLRKLAEINDLS